MTDDKIIKSNRRVKQDGEVFTPNQIVDKMLNLPGMKSKIRDIRATVLEPSAGEGAFLLPVLKLKMKSALKDSKNANDYNHYVLVALSSLYGVELLEDNISMLVMNMEALFRDIYTRDIKKFHDKVNKKVLASAKTIIHANVVQGDAISGKNGNGDKIVMSEWKPVDKFRVTRKNFYYLSAINHTASSQQLDIFAQNIDTDNPFPQYVTVDIMDVYRTLVLSK